ncbi:PH and SEC7 domain-containing protein 3-like Protein [Tribolium castaneum]|uniref:PH and SEC7 domain-containing protein 3-like Protein n=1 Tax=Tribolium castaneum TaxID=7070 RepID=A0A139WAA8_TRICA|nr:PH and SEC7 domain-containing protein 3-like Protein [Tribolium castaneum]
MNKSFIFREQLRDHEERVLRLESELEDHRKSPPDKGSKSLIVQNYKEKESYLTFEVKRYRTYSYILRSRIGQYVEPHPVSLVENSIGEVDEAAAAGGPMDVTGGVVVPPPIPDRPAPSTNRRGPE